MGEHGKDPRFAALYGLMVVEARITERLDAALEASAGISLSRLELLLHLHWKDGRRRMSDLADALLLSRGGATRLVAKAEEEGLVRREIPPDDRRATYAVLTDAGREAAERRLPDLHRAPEPALPGARDRRRGGAAGAHLEPRPRRERDGLRADQRGGGRGAGRARIAAALSGAATGTRGSRSWASAASIWPELTSEKRSR